MFIVFLVIMLTLVVAGLLTYLLTKTKYFSQSEIICDTKDNLPVQENAKKLLKRGLQIGTLQSEKKSSVSKLAKHDEVVPTAVVDSTKALSGVVKKAKNKSITPSKLEPCIKKKDDQIKLAEVNEKSISELHRCVENLQNNLKEKIGDNENLQQSYVELTSQVELLTTKCNDLMILNQVLEDKQKEQTKKCALLSEQLQMCAMQYDCDNILEEPLLNGWSGNDKSVAVGDGLSPCLSVEGQVQNLSNLFSACNEKLKDARREVELLQQASQIWHNLENKLNIDLRQLENELALERQHSASVMCELKTIMDEKMMITGKLQDTCQYLDQLKFQYCTLQSENKHLHDAVISTNLQNSENFFQSVITTQNSFAEPIVEEHVLSETTSTQYSATEPMDESQFQSVTTTQDSATEPMAKSQFQSVTTTQDSATEPMAKNLFQSVTTTQDSATEPMAENLFQSVTTTQDSATEPMVENLFQSVTTTQDSATEPMAENLFQSVTTSQDSSAELIAEKPLAISFISLACSTNENYASRVEPCELMSDFNHPSTQIDHEQQHQTKLKDTQSNLEHLSAQLLQAQRVANEQSELCLRAQEEAVRFRSCLGDTDESLRLLLSIANKEQLEWEEKLIAVSAERDAAQAEVHRLLGETALEEPSFLGDCSFFSSATEANDLEELRRCVTKEKKQTEELRKALLLAQDSLQQEQDLVAKLQEQINQQLLQQPAAKTKRKRGRISILLRALNCSCAKANHQERPVDSSVTPFAVTKSHATTTS